MIEYLKWDSEFFGLTIGKISNPSLSTEEFSETINMARNHGYQLLYIFFSEISYTANLIENSGAIFVDEKVTFRKKVPDLSSALPFQVLSYAGAINQTLKNLAIESGKYSRFKSDKNLCHKFSDLYEAWMVNSLNKTMADETLVAKINDNIVGMVTLKKNDITGKIGIIAVDEKYRGQGIGTALLNAADNWYINEVLTYAEVVTQRANKPACYLYERNNYHVHHVEFIFHYYIK